MICEELLKPMTDSASPNIMNRLLASILLSLFSASAVVQAGP
jgi:hypothetical protein